MARNNVPVFRAGGTINISVCVKMDTAADNQVVMCSAITDKAIGISKRSQRDAPGLPGSSNAVAALAGDGCEVYGPGEIAPAIAGAAITRGDWVGPEGAATGRIVTVSGATHRCVGFALESAAAAGVEIQIMVNPFAATLP